jgi:hypothetical protein
MPLFRYFMVTGGGLVALLLVVDRFAGRAENDLAQAEQGTPTIRINSDEKWPEKIVFDTSAPRIPAPAIAAAVVAPPSAPAAVDKAREAFALAPQPAAGPKPATSAPPKRVAVNRHRRSSTRMAAHDQPMFFQPTFFQPTFFQPTPFGPRRSASRW